MGFALAPGVSACIADGQLVLLNLQTGRYAMPPTRLAPALMRLLRREAPLAQDGGAHENLRALGVLVSTTDLRSPDLCRQSPPTDSFLERPWDTPSRRAVLSSGLHLCWAKTALRHFGLARTLGRLSSITPSSRQAIGSVVATASAFAELRLLVRPLDRCLPLSIALARVAKRHDANVRIVLGVACNPFAAHAWVQQGDTVLNDRIDSVMPFTPILAL